MQSLNCFFLSLKPMVHISHGSFQRKNAGITGALSFVETQIHG